MSDTIDGLPYLVDEAGVIRKLGALEPPAGLLSSFDLFEDAVPNVMLTDDQIRDLLANGPKSGRAVFDESWICDQKSFGCHRHDTQVLTDRGWTAWSEYNWKDSLGTMNPVTGFLEYQAPTAKHVYDYDGELYHCTNRRLNFAVTPNHRMYVRKWDERKRTLNNSYEFTTAEKIGWYAGVPHATRGFSGIDAKRISIPGGREYSGDDFVALCALIASNGFAGGAQNNQGRVSFCYFKDDIREDILGIAKRTGFTEQPSRRGVWYINDPALAEWTRSSAYVSPELGAVNKRVPLFVQSLCERQIHHFMKFFADKSDSGECRTFYSVSPHLIDGIQELLLKIGKRSSIVSRPPRTSVMKDGREVCGNYAEHALIVANKDKLSICRKTMIETDRYKGQVYCATVPNGLLVTRHNGSVLISGNSCNGWASAKALEAARHRKGLARVKLSGSSVYARINGGRDNGSIPEEAVEVMQRYGAVPEGPSRVDEIFMSHYTAADWQEALNYRAGECYITRSRQAFLSGIALGWDGVVAVHAGNRYMRVDGDGVAGADAGRGNHAVRIDGGRVLGNRILLDQPGSWNVTYGVRGRAYLEWERHLVGTVGTFAFYLIRTAQDSPNAVNPPAIQ